MKCAFTTKTAVYVLMRVAFPALGVLAIIGAWALYGVGYAVIENDARRILAYHVVSQVGYMVCGVGIGTSDGTERRRGPRLCPHHLQGTIVIRRPAPCWK